MKRDGKVEKMTYFDEELDRDLIDHLAPYYGAKRGNDELLRLARIGLALLKGSRAPITTLPASQDKDEGQKHKDGRAIRDASTQGPVRVNVVPRAVGTDPKAALERAQRAAQSDFKFKG